jgi:hypothetical protein
VSGEGDGAGSDVGCCRVEIKYAGRWGTICSPNMDADVDVVAQVICRQAFTIISVSLSVHLSGMHAHKIFMHFKSCAGKRAVLLLRLVKCGGLTILGRLQVIRSARRRRGCARTSALQSCVSVCTEQA